MPLSDREQRLLDEMERNLYHSDADYVATVGAGRVRASVRAITLGIVAGLLGIGLLVAGVMLQQPVVGIVGFVAMFAGALLAIAPPRRLGRVDTAHLDHPVPHEGERWEPKDDAD